MAYTVPNVFADGVTTVVADVIENFTDFRSWVNGSIILTDLDNDSIPLEAFYKPDAYGYPVDGLLAQSQENYARARTDDDWRHMVSDKTANANSRKTKRLDLFTSMVEANGAMRLPGLIKTIVVHSAGWVKATAWWSADSVDQDAGAGPRQSAGYFQMSYRKRGSTPTAFFSGRRNLLLRGGMRSHNHFMQGAFNVLAANVGVYDIWVAWHNTGAHADFRQATVGNRGMHVEYLPT